MQAPPPATMESPERVTTGGGQTHDIGMRQLAREGTEQTDNMMCSTYGLDLLILTNTCFIVPERSAVVELFLGKYIGTITKPGIYCRNSCFVELRKVSTSITPIDLPNVKVADAQGSPLLVSGIVTYEITDSRRAAIDVPDAHNYVLTQAPAVLKRVISQFPYDSETLDVACLRREPQVVSALMMETLQDRVRVAGVRIESFAINELSYAPEIAHSMLKRQQAGALIEARQRIVQGATDIAKNAARDEELSNVMTPSDRSRLVANLLVVLVSDKDATPVIEV